MRTHLLRIAALVAIGLSGCTVEIGGLREAAQAVDNMREQIDKTTKEGGDLDRLLAQAREDIGGLIEQAERAGGRLEEKVVLDLIEQRTQLILDATALMKKTNLTIKGSAFAVTEELSRMMGRLPADLSDQIGPLVLAMPTLNPSTQPVRVDGTELTFRSEGYYRLTFDARQAANLAVRLDHGAIFPPNNPAETRVAVEIPASTLAGRFRDSEREFVPIELVDLKAPAKVRYLGSLDLKPLFAIRYRLIERGPGGEVRRRTVDRGSAIMRILDAVSAAMHSEDAEPLAVARRHGEIYSIAREKLPYGTSFVELSPGVDDFELTITTEDGRTRTLDENTTSFGGVSINWKETVRPDGIAVLRLTIQADPPTSG